MPNASRNPSETPLVPVFAVMPVIPGMAVMAVIAVMACTTPALAQLQPPEPLPSGPLGPRLLFESPWSLVLALSLLGIAVGLGRLGALRPAGHRGVLRGVAMAVAVLAITLAATQALVRTPKEEISSRTRELVAAVAEGNSQTLRALLADGCTATYFRAPEGIGKEQIISQVTGAFGSGEPADATIGVLQAVADNTAFGRAQLRVTVTHDLTERFPYGSWWLVHWKKKDGGQWQAIEIRLLSAPGFSGPG